MSISTIPEWKAKLIEKKKAERLKFEQIPIWKRDLLQRIHAKNDAVRNRLLLNRNNSTNEDTAVIKEHISKVSKNFFIQMELERQIKSPSLLSQQTQCQHQPENKSKLISSETLESGFVDRPKSQSSFEVHLTPVKFRSKSAVESPRNDRLPDDTFASSKSHLYQSSVQSSTTTKLDDQLRVRKSSIDIITPRGFSRTPSYSTKTSSIHTVASTPTIKKFSAPVTSKQKTASYNGSACHSVSTSNNNAASTLSKNIFSTPAQSRSDVQMLPKTVISPTLTSLPSDKSDKNQSTERIFVSNHKKFDRDQSTSSESNETTSKIAFKPVPTQIKSNTSPVSEKLLVKASVIVPGSIANQLSNSFESPAVISQNKNSVDPNQTLRDPSSSKAKTISTENKTEIETMIAKDGLSRVTTKASPAATSRVGPSSKSSVEVKFDVIEINTKSNLSKCLTTPAKNAVPKAETISTENKTEKETQVVEDFYSRAATKSSLVAIPHNSSSSTSLVQVNDNQASAVTDIKCQTPPAKNAVLKTKTILAEISTKKETQAVKDVFSHPHVAANASSAAISRKDLSSKSSVLVKYNQASAVTGINSNSNINKSRKPPPKYPKPKLINCKAQESNSKLNTQENSLHFEAKNNQAQEITAVASNDSARVNVVVTKNNRFASDLTKQTAPHVLDPKKPHQRSAPNFTVLKESSDVKKKETVTHSNKEIQKSDAKLETKEKSVQQTLVVERLCEKAKEKVPTCQDKKDVTETSPSKPSRKLSGAGVVSTNNFGGKTFMIDPSKFKKNSQNSLKNEPQPDTTTATKGKRKLRVDQIVVIGGYVKLERSSLLKPNKIRKQVRVKFLDNSLELVFNYPSEKSLLQEEGVSDSVLLPSRNVHLLPSKRDSQLDSVAAKALLAMKQDELNSSDEDD